MAKKKKYYVVWEGNETGVFDTWAETQLHIKGYPNAKYKSFKTKEEAEAAYHGSAAADHIGKEKKPPNPMKVPETDKTRSDDAIYMIGETKLCIKQDTQDSCPLFNLQGGIRGQIDLIFRLPTNGFPINPGTQGRFFEIFGGVVNSKSTASIGYIKT